MQMDDFDMYLEVLLARMLDRVVERPAPPRRGQEDRPLPFHSLVGGLTGSPLELIVGETVPVPVPVVAPAR